MLEDTKTWGGRTLRIAGEEINMTRVVEIFERSTGVPAAYQPMTDREFLNSGLPNAHDPLNNMIIYREGYYVRRDFDKLKKLHPHLQDWQTWLSKSGWKGEGRQMRKDAPTG